MALRVDLEQMAGSATVVTGTGENVAVEHASSDAGIAAAHTGRAGTSSAALASRLEQWTVTCQALIGRLSDHAQDLHGAANAHSTNEQERAHDVARLA